MPRPTPVRDAVVMALESGSRHEWSIEDLTSALKGAGARADYSSVFRALVYLENEGFVEKFELGDGKAHFERAGEHHEHLRCERCGDVAAMPGCLLDDVQERVRRETGFELNSHTVVLTGVCPSCQN